MKKALRNMLSKMKADDRLSNRLLHHSQTAMYWLAMFALAGLGIALSTPEMPWVWVGQLAMIVLFTIGVALGGRTYLIWPDFKGNHDDYK